MTLKNINLFILKTLLLQTWNLILYVKFFQLNKFSKMKNRVREFNNIREIRLSQSNSQLYISSQNSESQFSHTKQTSKNMTKKEPICLDCVNHKLISQKKQKLQKQKQQKFQSGKQFQKIKLNQESLRDMRSKMIKQASLYNHKAAQSNKRREQFERRQEQLMMKSNSSLQIQLIKNECKLQQEHQKKIEKYKRQLQLQYKQQAIKKDLIKKQKFATQPNESLIPYKDSTQIIKRYHQQLKKQIKQNQIRSQQLKKMQNQIDNQTITNFDKDFFKYSQFDSKNKNKQQNPEIFQEMKKRQFQKKIEKIDQRQKKQKERKQQLLKAKKQAQLIAQKSLKNIKSYANILETQIASKKKQEQFARKMQKSSFLEQLKNEQVNEQADKRPCGQCCKTVKEITLSYY